MSDIGDMSNWAIWSVKSDEYDFEPITDEAIRADMIKIRVKLAHVAIKFKELVGDFSQLAARLSPFGNIRMWGNSVIEVTINRDEELILIETHQKNDDPDTASLTLCFETPDTWDQPVHLEPLCASGKVEDILALADLFLKEWPSCHRLKYSQSQQTWI